MDVNLILADPSALPDAQILTELGFTLQQFSRAPPSGTAWTLQD